MSDIGLDSSNRLGLYWGIRLRVKENLKYLLLCEGNDQDRHGPSLDGKRLGGLSLMYTRVKPRC